MPRVRPRSNIYAFMPVLATLIMVFGIVLTWMRVADYTGEVQPKPVPPVEGPRYPELEALAAEVPATEKAAPEELGAPPEEEAAPTEDEVAPEEGPAPKDEVAPEEEEAAPAEGKAKEKEEEEE